MSRRPEIVILAAVAEKDRLIGRGLSLPWHIPEDLKHFKRLTLGHPMLMGRRTFESLVEQVGGPLPGRRHLVVSGSREFSYDGVEVFRSVDEALAAASGEDRLFVTGGATMYAHFLELADRLELTLVEGDHAGDVFFPPYEHLLGTRYLLREERKRDGYRFVSYVVREPATPDPGRPVQHAP
jgi:dihydrofolate reductase